MRWASDCSLRLLLFLSVTAMAPAALASVDYAVGPGDLLLQSSAPAAGGQVIGVTRTIHNLEGAAPPCPYSYFLNPPNVFVEGSGVPVEILNPGQSSGQSSGPTYLGTTPPLGPNGQTDADDTATDQILIPDGMPPGTYNLVLVLDPEQQVGDADPSNNDTSVALSLTSNPLQITSPSALLVAVVGVPYQYALTAQGGGGQSTWSLLAGAPPNGITFDPLGELSGTPTEAGVFAIVVQVASGGGTQTALLELPVAAASAPVSIEQSGSQLPSAIVNSQYVLQLIAEGGVPPYSWTGMIPQALGLTFTSEGVLTGTPYEASNGPLEFTVTVTDSIGTQASATLIIEVVSPSSLAITTAFLEPGVVGRQYDQPLVASDGPVMGATFNWSLAAGTTLPNGLTFQQIGNPAVGDLSGEPTQSGIFPLIVYVSDNFGHSTMRQYILTVTEAAVPVQPWTPPEAVIGEPFHDTLEATSISTLSWSLFSGTLPPGLSLSATGVISGTVPVGTAPGIYPFAAAVTDATGAENVVALEIQVVEPPTQLQGHTQSGGCATGDGPTGAGLLLLAMIWLKSRMRRLRQRSRVVQLARGFALAAAGMLLLSAPAALALLTIETVNLPPGSTGQVYNFTIGAVGGVPPYQWALVTAFGTPPPGISFLSNGALIGEPEYDGTSNFQVSVTDSTGTTIISPVYSLAIFASGPLAVASTELETGFLGQTYKDTLHYSGGTPPYIWSLIDVVREPEYPGDLGSDLGASLMPIGLGFYPAQGEIEGVPIQVGLFALTVQVTDSESPPASSQGLVLLRVSSTATFSFETVQLPPATLNESYSTTIETNAPANDTVVCQVINRSISPGLTFDSNCQIQGTPLEAGIYSFLVVAIDTQGGVAEQSFSIQVNDPVAPVKPSAGGGGCQSAPGGPALAGLLLLAMTRVRRRSRVWRTEPGDERVA